MTSRSFTGLVLAAALLAPAAAAAQTSTGGSGFALGVLGGVEWGDDSGYSLRLDGEVPIVRASPNLQLAGVVSVSYSGLDNDVSLLEAVGAARLIYQANPQFGGYGDLGLGFSRMNRPGDDGTGATMRIGLGAFYQMNRQVQFPLELMFHPRWGDEMDSTTTLMVGAKFRF
ncbi:MAG TPA: outer membrane beta-barrel protein [Anaeromyxobacter sp.]|nr:outer membrane beta-barrel protein [Anaeromyxobacter sp.]